jgi:hypothetical protein
MKGTNGPDPLLMGGRWVTFPRSQSPSLTSSDPTTLIFRRSMRFSFVPWMSCLKLGHPAHLRSRPIGQVGHSASSEILIPNSCFGGTLALNSLPAMDTHERPLFIELRGTEVSHQIFIRSQSLIAHWTCNDPILAAVARNLYETCRTDDVSRGSKPYLFWAS